MSIDSRISDAPTTISAPLLDSSFLGEDLSPGQGIVGKTWSVAVTAARLASGVISSYSIEHPDTTDPNFLGLIDRVQHPGKKLTNIDLVLFFQGFNQSLKKLNLPEFSYFLGFVHGAISHWSLVDAKKELERFSRENLALTTLCIPFVIEGCGWFERRHITVMLIMDGMVSYYDSKGKSSALHLLSEGGTLRELIEFCRDHWASQTPIIENKDVVQYDINSCGVHVAHYVYTRIVEKRAFDAPISEQEVLDFRRKFIEIAFGNI